MKDVSIKWYYESDGDDHARTHYICNEAMDARIDCASKAHALKLRDALNGPIPIGTRPSQHAVNLISLTWRNLNTEGFDPDAANAIIHAVMLRANLTSAPQTAPKGQA